DVGTGSGVLSIAAVLLGAASVVAIDIDPVAVEVARANCAANAVGDRVAVSAGRLDAEWPATYELVVSNISTEANTGLLPAFARVVAPGGSLILSGILEVDAPAVAARAEGLGFALRELRCERDWAVIDLKQSLAGG